MSIINEQNNDVLDPKTSKTRKQEHKKDTNSNLDFTKNNHDEHIVDDNKILELKLKEKRYSHSNNPPETPEPTPTPVSTPRDSDGILTGNKNKEQRGEKEEDDEERGRETITKGQDPEDTSSRTSPIVDQGKKNKKKKDKEEKKEKKNRPKSIYEYRIVMPMKADELNIGFQYTIARSSVEEVTHDDKVRVLSNEPCVDENGNPGQHTLKVYHIKSYFPALLSRFMSNESLTMYEDSKDCFPYTFTRCTSKTFKTFNLSIETKVVDGDRGHIDNIFELAPDELKTRNVVYIDILNTPSHYPDTKNDPRDIKKFTKSKVVCLKDYNPDTWREEVPRVCCAYKLVKCDISMPLATMITRTICKTQGDVFNKYYKRVYSWADCWANMTMSDVEGMALSAVEEGSEEKSLEIRKKIVDRKREKDSRSFSRKVEEAQDRQGPLSAGISSREASGD